MILAGTPAIRPPAGNSAFSRTTAPLATTDPEPITAPLLIVEFMPTKQASPIEHRWPTAAYPTVTRRPITAGKPRSTCTTALSWTFESRPTTIESKSPRSTAPCQMLAPSSTVTSPTRTALGATYIIVSLEVHEDILDVGVEQDRVDALLLTEPRLFPPEEGRLREGDRELVNRDHARLQPSRDCVPLRNVLGPDARREAVGRVVRLRDGVVHPVEGPCRHDRAEDLLAGHPRSGRRILEDGRSHKVSVLQLGGIRPTASREKLRSLLDPVLDRLDDVRGVLAGDEGAHLHVVLQGRSEPQFLRLLLELGEERRRNRLVHEQLRPGPAHLARVLERAPESALDGPVDLRVCEDNLRILAAEFEGRRHDPIRDDAEELLPGVRGARESDRVDVGMRRESSADLPTRACDDVYDPAAEARSSRELSQFEGRERGQGGWLQHDRIPGSERGGHPSGGEEQWIVPRSDVGRHSERLPQGVIESGARDRDRVALNFICHSGIIFEQLVDVRDVALRFAQRLPDVLGLEPRELVKMVPHLLAQEPEQSSPFARIHLAPLRGFEGGLGRFDRRVDVVLRPGRYAGDRSIRRGIDHLRGLLRGRGDRLPGDVEAVVANFHRRSAPTIGRRTISVWLSLLCTGGLLFRASVARARGHRAGRRAREPHASMAGGGEGVRLAPSVALGSVPA